jgi:hypothetical protein
VGFYGVVTTPNFYPHEGNLLVAHRKEKVYNKANIMSAGTILRKLRLSQSGTITLAVMVGSMGSYEMLEPVVSRAAATNTFTVQQTISAEISFLATSTGVTLTGSIAGITGGTATGTTQVVVLTNSAGGYNMTLGFSGTPAMRGNATGNTGIVNYGTTSVPTFNFFASTSAVFAFSVNASNSPDVAAAFKNNGTTCNTGSTVTANTCWMGPSTTAMQIVNRGVAATTSATTTLVFKVNVPNNPFPALQSDTYTATATLTATAQ